MILDSSADCLGHPSERPLTLAYVNSKFEATKNGASTCTDRRTPPHFRCTAYRFPRRSRGRHRISVRPLLPHRQHLPAHADGKHSATLPAKKPN